MNLYYSLHCEYSKQIIEAMKNTGLSTHVSAICIDNNSFPNSLTRVPAISLENGNVLVGKQAFDFVHSQASENNNAAATVTPAKTEIMGPELGSASVGYAFIGDRKDIKDTFSFDNSALSSCSIERITDVHENQSGTQSKEKDKETSSRGDSSNLMDKLLAQREQDIPPPMNRS